MGLWTGWEVCREKGARGGKTDGAGRGRGVVWCGVGWEECRAGDKLGGMVTDLWCLEKEAVCTVLCCTVRAFTAGNETYALECSLFPDQNLRAVQLARDAMLLHHVLMDLI